ncbi:MAG: DNA repair protein RecN [Bacillota bacterium]
MLVEMTIEHFALIEKVHLPIGPGLNVLTGETGAGKSIVLDALEVALGGRVSGEMVRTGEERAIVEAVFDLTDRPQRKQALAEMGIDVGEDNLLVVRREISRTGRGRISLNGRAATVQMLREATEGLCDLHGQHEHHTLLQPEKHLDLLDQYGGSLLKQEGKPLELLDQYAGAPILALREEVARLHQELEAIQAELRELRGDERDRARREDLLRFQVEELEAARLRPGEEEELEAELQRLANATRLKQAAAQGYALLYEAGPRQEAAADLIGRAEALLADAARIDPGLSPVLEYLQAAQANIQEAARFLADYQEQVEDDPERLAQVEQRLTLLHNLKRKYGDTVAEMLEYLEQIRAELARLQGSEERAAELERRLEEVGAAAAQAAARLSQARREAAAELGERVARELRDLGMPHAQFIVRVDSPAEADWRAVGPKGWDRVEFLFSPNVGEPPRPLAKIVSGGEMSRIMLALKVILARVDEVATLVFDEVDTGIGGRTAQAVAEKLAAIARDRQVICVTHLPQVAAMADHHLLITKEEVGGRTRTRVQPLDEEGRSLEIARMIGGAEITPLTLEHARELIRAAAALRRGG